jgi:hypothetical protein
VFGSVASDDSVSTCLVGISRHFNGEPQIGCARRKSKKPSTKVVIPLVGFAFEVSRLSGYEKSIFLSFPFSALSSSGSFYFI